MEGPKKKENTPRSEWIADTAFDEINLLSDAIKYLSIQYHPSSSALFLSFFFFFFLLLASFFFLFLSFFFFFAFHFWKAEGARVGCLLGSLVCNLEWCMGGYCRECKLKTNIYPSTTIADYRWTGATTRSFETEEELRSFARIYLWYLCVSLPGLSLFSSCGQSLLNMDERKLKICF